MSSFLGQEAHKQVIPKDEKGAHKVPEPGKCPLHWVILESFQLTVCWPSSHNRAGLLRELTLGIMINYSKCQWQSD